MKALWFKVRTTAAALWTKLRSLVGVLCFFFLVGSAQAQDPTTTKLLQQMVELHKQSNELHAQTKQAIASLSSRVEALERGTPSYSPPATPTTYASYSNSSTSSYYPDLSKHYDMGRVQTQYDANLGRYVDVTIGGAKLKCIPAY